MHLFNENSSNFPKYLYIHKITYRKSLLKQEGYRENRSLITLRNILSNTVRIDKFIFQVFNYMFSSLAQLCLTLCNPMNCSSPRLPVHHQLLESTQTHVHWVSDAIQPSHPLPSPSPPTFNPSQHQGLFKWVSSSHQVAKVLEFQLQHHSFQRTPRADLF